MGELWIFIIFAAAATVIFVTYFTEHSRLNHEWMGLVKDKKIKDYFYKGQQRTVYILKILKDNGEKITIDVTEDKYKSIEIGDRVRKQKGQYYPEKDI